MCSAGLFPLSNTNVGSIFWSLMRSNRSRGTTNRPAKTCCRIWWRGAPWCSCGGAQGSRRVACATTATVVDSHGACPLDVTRRHDRRVETKDNTRRRARSQPNICLSLRRRRSDANEWQPARRRSSTRTTRGTLGSEYPGNLGMALGSFCAWFRRVPNFMSLMHNERRWPELNW